MQAQYAIYRAARRLKYLAVQLGVSLACLYQRARRAGLTAKDCIIKVAVSPPQTPSQLPQLLPAVAMLPGFGRGAGLHIGA